MLCASDVAMSEPDNNTPSGREWGGPSRHTQQGNSGPGRDHRRWGKQNWRQAFTGNTKEMNSQVFQLHTEQ